MALRLGVIVIGLLGWVAVGEGTTVLEKSLTDLVQEADTVVVGTVSAIEAEWDAASETPFTYVTFTDLDILKGETDQTELILQFLGGPRPDGTVLQIAGVPQFAVGERNVLFVTGNGHHAVPFVGLWQGVYRVVFDPDRDTETVYTHTMQPLTALPVGGGNILHDEGPDGHHAQALHSGVPMALEDFTQQIVEEMYRD